MVVDDNPANLKLLEDMLREKGYAVRSFPRGRLALESAAQNPPDLILLDVNMPEMTGYEVCERIRAIEEVPGIPVLFISALNETGDKLKGFGAGGVDYISKPFQFEEVYARVETHLKLRRAQQAEQELLELTFNGAIRMLANLLHANSPELAARSRAIRDCSMWITRQMGLSDPWQYDLAATLCLIGCITLPEEVFKAAYAGEAVSPEAEAMFAGHPESAARLLTNLPRLEPIAEMIRLQQTPDADHVTASYEVRLGAGMLFLATELDRRVYRGMPFRAALQQIQSADGRVNPAMLAALENYSPASADFHRQALPIKKLFAGMALEEDVVGQSTGILILKKGTVLTETWIERLENFARFQGVPEPLPVLVPGPASLPVFPVSRRSPPQQDGRQGMNPSARFPSIMVVDDEPANLKLLEGMLRRKDYTVRSFPRGPMAIESAVHNPPDLILLDVSMPEMSGLEVCARLTADPRVSEVPIIFLSALNETEDKVRALRAGGVDYITKPFQFDEVYARVETHLKLVELRRALKLQNERLEETVDLRTRELAHANAQLLLLDAAKSDFLRIISHELRTPLNGLLAVSELILDESPLTDQNKEFRRMFEQSRERFLSLLNDALLLTQIEAGAWGPKSTEVDLNVVLNRAIDRTAEFARSRHVTIDAPDTDLGVVHAEEDLLVRAVHALLETAVRFSKESGVVSFTEEVSPDSTVLNIECDGQAIPAPAIGKFFDVFAIGEALTPGGDLAGCGKIPHSGYLETRVAVSVLCEATTSSKAGYLATGRPRSGCRKIIRCGR